MIDIQIQKCDLIEVIGSIINEKVKVENQDACEYLATEIVNGLENYNSEETQANNLLGLNSALRHEVKASNHSKKITLSANEEAFSSNDNNVDVRSSN